MHVIAAKAVAFGEALHPSFKIYQTNVLENAKIFSDVLNNSPLRIVSGGTDSHLILVDLKDSPFNGKEAEKMLEKASITVNKNTIPNDPESPFVTSGIRIGTAAITTRGFSKDDIQSIAEFIKDILISKHSNDNQYLSDISKKIKEISSKYPLFDNSNSIKSEKVVAKKNEVSFFVLILKLRLWTQEYLKMVIQLKEDVNASVVKKDLAHLKLLK